jgi:cell wall-associated NlpC family hydrolase
MGLNGPLTVAGAAAYVRPAQRHPARIPPPTEAEGDSPVTAQLRLALLVLALACALVAAQAHARAARTKASVTFRPPPEKLFTTETLFAHVPRRRQARSALGARVVRYARHLLGVPYSWGGASPATGFDCSGFVRFVFRHFGVQLPHSSYAQFDLGRGVARRALRPGDLVFFDGLGHVGLYVGKGRFIHAPHTGSRVEIDTLTGWYSGAYDGARRVA